MSSSSRVRPGFVGFVVGRVGGGLEVVAAVAVREGTTPETRTADSLGAALGIAETAEAVPGGSSWEGDAEAEASDDGAGSSLLAASFAAGSLG